MGKIIKLNGVKITASSAWAYVNDANVNPDGAYTAELARLTIEEGDAWLLVNWSEHHQEYSSEMFDALLSTNDLITCYYWLRRVRSHQDEIFQHLSTIGASTNYNDYCYIMSCCFIAEIFPSYDIKVDVVKNDAVQDFINFVKKDLQDSYSLGDFYSDLPSSYKVNVVV